MDRTAGVFGVRDEAFYLGPGLGRLAAVCARLAVVDREQLEALAAVGQIDIMNLERRISFVRAEQRDKERPHRHGRLARVKLGLATVGIVDILPTLLLNLLVKRAEVSKRAQSTVGVGTLTPSSTSPTSLSSRW